MQGMNAPYRDSKQKTSKYRAPEESHIKHSGNIKKFRFVDSVIEGNCRRGG